MAVADWVDLCSESAWLDAIADVVDLDFESDWLDSIATEPTGGCPPVSCSSFWEVEECLGLFVVMLLNTLKSRSRDASIEQTLELLMHIWGSCDQQRTLCRRIELLIISQSSPLLKVVLVGE